MQLYSTANPSIDGVKVCVFGPAGSGKSRLCATAPTPVIFSAEKGLLSLRDFNIPYAPVNGLKDLDDKLKWAQTSAEAKQFKTICLDSVSDIAEQILDEERRKTKDGRQYWTNTAIEMMAKLRAFRDLPGKHVYMIAKLDRAKNEMGGVINVPSMPGRELTDQLPYMFDEIYSLEQFRDQNSGQLIPWLRTRADGLWAVKSRGFRLDEWEPANLSHIFTKILAA